MPYPALGAILLGGVATVALAVVVYTIIASKRKPVAYKNTQSDAFDLAYYDRNTKSVSSSPRSNDSKSDDGNNNVRKRQTPSQKTSSIEDNRNVDDNKIIHDKIMNDDKIVDKKISNKSNSEEHTSDKSVQCSDIPESAASFLLGNDNSLSRINHDSIAEWIQNAEFDESSDSSSWTGISSNSLNLESESSYKRKVRKTLQNDVGHKNKKKSSRSSSVSSSIVTESVSSFNTLLFESEICQACEVNNVNTQTEPCHHRYMCSDCAMRIFRIYKKCRICRQKIEKIAVSE